MFLTLGSAITAFSVAETICGKTERPGRQKELSEQCKLLALQAIFAVGACLTLPHLLTLSWTVNAICITYGISLGITFYISRSIINCANGGYAKDPEERGDLQKTLAVAILIASFNLPGYALPLIFAKNMIVQLYDISHRDPTRNRPRSPVGGQPEGSPPAYAGQPAPNQQQLEEQPI